MFDSQSEKIERAKRGIAKVEALLKGELQAEGVRKFLGINSGEDYPRLEELPFMFFIPPEIVSRLSSITNQSKDSRREREFFVGFSNQNWWLSKTHLGENEINDSHRDLFPKKRPKHLIMEVHTHLPIAGKEGGLRLPTAPDIATLVAWREYLAMMVSAPTGAWLMIKGKEYFQKETETKREEIWAIVNSVVQRKIDYLISMPELTTVSYCENYFAQMLAEYGIAFYSSNPNYGFLKSRLRPILDPKEVLGMHRITTE